MDLELHEGFFYRIKQWVRAHNTTIEAVMDASGSWTKAVYYGWRKSDGLPKGENILALARYMGVSCDWLISGSDRIPLLAKYADVLQDLEVMDDVTRNNACLMISSLAENCRKKSSATAVV